MKIFLLRHAKSVHNDANTWTGHIDADLSPGGIAEQVRLCSLFEYPDAEILLSSPLRRCTRSLEIIYGKRPYYAVPELIECALGSLEGKPYTNLDDDPNYLRWLAEPELSFHGGESFGEFTRRSRAGFAKLVGSLIEERVRSVVIMTHGNVMRAVLSGFIDRSVPHGRWHIPNGGGYLFDIYDVKKEPSSYEVVPEFLFDRVN
jgi:alpha-ribazole phosphatase